MRQAGSQALLNISNSKQHHMPAKDRLFAREIFSRGLVAALLNRRQFAATVREHLRATLRCKKYADTSLRPKTDFEHIACSSLLEPIASERLRIKDFPAESHRVRP